METQTSSQRVFHSRYQYSLWHLLALISAVAFVLGAWRLLGAWILIGPVVAVAVFVPAVWRPRWLFVWLLPVVWTSVAWTNFYYPGDEYGSFVAGSLAGVWIALVVQMSGSPANMLPPLLMAGALTVAVAGLLMDLLRVRWTAWIVLWLGAAMLLFAWSFGSFASVERAISKNGSIQAYILPSINLGLYFASITMLLGAGAYRLFCRLRNRIARDSTMNLPPG